MDKCVWVGQHAYVFKMNDSVQIAPEKVSRSECQIALGYPCHKSSWNRFLVFLHLLFSYIPKAYAYVIEH